MNKSLRNILNNAKIKPQHQHDPARVRVLSATGRTEPVVDRVRTPAQIMAGNEQLKKLLELRDQL